MAKIERYDGNLVPFGSNALSGERTVFGSDTTSDSLDDNITSELLRGWGVVGANDFPPLEWFNAVNYTTSRLISYLFQTGIAEWNTNQEYHLNSIVLGSDGNIYKSLSNDNIGNNPTTDSANWNSAFDSANFVNLTTAQTVGGVKTFASFPVTPSSAPITDYQVANKKYVDDNAGDVFTADFTGSNQSLLANGYQKLPGGLILQWGTFNTGSIGNNPGPVTQNLPITFPNAHLNTIIGSTAGTIGGNGASEGFFANNFQLASFDWNSFWQSRDDTTYGQIRFFSIGY